MATTYTPNYDLGKQEDPKDLFNMDTITDNMDAIDTQMKRTADNIANTRGVVTDITPILNQILNTVSAIQQNTTSINSNVTNVDGKLGDTNEILDLILDGYAGASSKVTFYDYDGTVAASYTKDEFIALTEMPSNPSHEGLTAQGWNYSLADAKTYVTANGSLNIGQMYMTDDGKTRLYITLTEGRISPILQLYLNANSELDIDWGDGGSHSTFTSTTAGYKSERHEYATPGDYVIAITVTSGSFVLQSSTTSVSGILWNGNNNASSPDRAYNNSIKKIEIGTGISSIDSSAFTNCFSLTSITIPDTVTSIDSSAFTNCYSLTSITIPDTVTSISSSVFSSCYALSSITIPNGVTSIGGSAFTNCYSLTSITIPDTVTSIGSNAFNNCYSLQSITIPDTVTSIGGSAFSNCYSLTSITIPNGVTSIGGSAFSSCSSLSSITIGSGVTTIGGSAFSGCSYMESIKFKSTTPPTVSSSNAWQNVPTTCKIYVPSGSLSAYTSATNYPSSSSYTYIEY